MRGISVKQAAAIVGGKLSGKGNVERELRGLVIDSRLVEPDFAFAAIPGERVDGHDYVGKAFELGAACCIVERDIPDAQGCLIVVDSTAKAMARLAEEYRNTLGIPVIGITGSVGKTTAKEMISSVLSQRFNVLKTDKNFNNELGVPLTIFRIEPEHEAAVIEMGISDFGEMSRLAQMVRPTDAVYTLIGNAHLDRLGDRSGVFKAKTEMLDFMSDNGTVFLNADDDLLCTCSCRQNKVLYGLGENADVRAENIKTVSAAMQTCDIISGQRRMHVSIPAYGRHMVYAALEGAAVGIKFGLTDDEIIRGIVAYKTVGRRANVIDTGYITIIDDCYNANPQAMAETLRLLAGTHRPRRMAVLGDMFDLGDLAAEAHEQIGLLLNELKLECVVAIGQWMKYLTETARGNVYHFDTVEQACETLHREFTPGTAVLVKASHAMHFEKIVEELEKA